MGKLAASGTAPATNRHGIKVGDIFVEHWGYDQSNIDVYVVVDVTNTMVGLQKGRVEIVEGRVRPVPGSASPFVGKYARGGVVTRKGTIRKRVLVFGDGDPYLSMTSYSIATLWNGEATYFDTIAAGYPGH